jgi:hypothetical protein
MILGDPAQAPAQPPRGQIRLSIDEMFRRLAERRPGAPALADPPNRESFTDGAPRRLTYAEADRMVAAIAGRLHRMGLPVDAIIGVQMPNIVENFLAMLGILRAGMIVAPLPLLWRRADAVAALARVGAKALITCGRVGDFKHSQFGMRVAAEVFAIRYVCGFGAKLPDGVVPFDDLFAADNLDPVPPLERERQANAPAHLAAITFDAAEGGLVPVARNHSELVAAALVVLLESRLAQNAKHPLDACALLVRRAEPDAAAVAPHRRHALASSSLRCGRSHAAEAGRSLLDTGLARSDRLPAG